MIRINYEYSIDGVVKSLKECAKILCTKDSTLQSKVARSGMRTYTETILGYKFKAIKL